LKRSAWSSLKKFSGSENIGRPLQRGRGTRFVNLKKPCSGYSNDFG
jgi:hypothetical protein